MFGKILFLAGGVLLCGSALAEDAPPGPGRFQIAPDGDGFIRLDTETGRLTHCDKEEGVWRCVGVAENRSEVDRRILALQEEVAALKADLADIGDRLTAIEEHVGAAPPVPPASPDELSKQEKHFDDALSFAERLMQRFFDLIRELKNEQPPQQI